MFTLAQGNFLLKVKPNENEVFSDKASGQILSGCTNTTPHASHIVPLANATHRNIMNVTQSECNVPHSSV